jgi:hypothetical protein
MTVTSYIAKFSDPEGKKFHGSIFWDKYHPKRLTAQICPHISDSEVDYPVWTATATNGRTGFDALVAKMKGRAMRMDLQLGSEAETKFVPVSSGSGA